MSLEKEKTQVELANERGYKLPDFASFKPPKVMSGGHRETVKALAWSSDSRKLASCAFSSWGGENESFVRVWTPERSLDVRAATELNGHEKAVSSLDWDPVQPERLASAALDRTLKLWDIRSHTATSSLEFQRGLLSTAFHPSGNYIATSDMEDTVTLVDTRMNKILGLILEAGRVPSNFVHDKKKQVLSNNNQSNQATSNINGAGNRKGDKVVNPYLPLENKEEINKIKFSNDGSLFCMATSSGKVRMLDSRNLDFSHNSDQAESKQKQDQTMEVDKEPGEREKERNGSKDYIPWELAMDFRAHSANVFNLEFDNGGRYMVTSSAESTIGIWDTKEFMSVALNPDMEVTARDMSLSYDGEVIAGGGDGRQIFLISTTTGKTIHKIPIWGAKVTALAWHPSRYLLAYAGEEPGMIKLFGLDR